MPPGAYRWLSRTQIRSQKLGLGVCRTQSPLAVWTASGPTNTPTCSVEKTVAYFAAVAGETDLPFFAYWLGSTINQRFGNEL